MAEEKQGKLRKNVKRYRVEDQAQIEQLKADLAKVKSAGMEFEVAKIESKLQAAIKKSEGYLPIPKSNVFKGANKGFEIDRTKKAKNKNLNRAFLTSGNRRLDQ